MNAFESWQKANGDYLAAGLHWLRFRLTQIAGPLPRDGTDKPRSAGRRFFRRKQRSAVMKQPLPDKRPSATEVEEARSAMVQAEKADPPPAMMILSQRLGLSGFERHLLLLCAAMELDSRIASLCARAQDDPSTAYPTIALALATFPDPSWDVLSPERPLRYWRLIEINQGASQPLTSSALRADERIVNFLKGLNYLDDRLTPLLTPFDDGRANCELPPTQQSTADQISAINAHGAPVIQLLGPDAASKQLIAQHVGELLGQQLYRLPADSLPQQIVDLETLSRLWERESRLLPIALYLDVDEANDQQYAAIRRFLARSHGIFFVNTREARTDLGHNAMAVDVTKPTTSEQRTAWTQALDHVDQTAPTLLASQFDLDVETIRNIALSAAADSTDDEVGLQQRVWNLCLTHTRPRLETLAQRIDAKATWDDIVLSDHESDLLHQIADQVIHRTKVYQDWGFKAKMNRGLGINALFAGESGTGKTMAAEVIANDLRLDLYRIDLSGVVSKYIGETEKNLRRLFDAAEGGGAILFFDEADALFGKRSQVKDSHDRYANIEINYLLQRMEAYRGLAILATNMKSALDSAFLRRLRFIVNFPFPAAAERKRIWQLVFPEATPLEQLDYDRLARLNLAGGSIHNTALNAAFMAAESGTPVSMPLVLNAARAEFRKLERPVNEADFRWQQPTGVVA